MVLNICINFQTILCRNKILYRGDKIPPTDGQTDKVISIYPSKLCLQGYKNEANGQNAYLTKLAIINSAEGVIYKISG